MPTRKELLEQLEYEIEQLSGTVTEGSEALATSAEALDRHGETQLEAAKIISRGLTSASSEMIGAMFLGGFLWLTGKAVGTVVGALIDRVREINKKTAMIKSIQTLQGRHAPLTYEFIVERSIAEGASKDERQNILNELLHDGIVSSKVSEDGESLCIESDNPKLKAYWEWLDSMRAAAEEQRKKLSQ